jgi:short-subunit dehydrogenase
MPADVVVVTGASGGIGRATATAFAARGAKVALVARGQAGLEAAAADVRAAGGEALVLPADAADPAALETVADRVEGELGPVDVWVNDAFAGVFAPFEQITAEEFKRVNEVTYLGYVYGTMTALRRMKPRDRGVVVQIGSALAYRGIPLQTAYCGAKHAIQGFNEALRCELLHEKSGVHVTMVQMPAVNTPQFSWVLSRLPRHAQPVPPIYQPEVAADAIAWAARTGEREVYVGAPTWKTIWGERIAPGFADRYLAKNGYESQQGEEPVNGDRPDNLFAPLEGDRGAHGRFEEGSRRRSPLLWLGKHRRAIGVAALAGAGVTAAAAGLTRGR